MTTRATAALLAIAVSAAMPGRAGAVTYNGTLGFHYNRSDTWTPEEHAIVPNLSFDGSLTAAGYLFAPYIASWSGGVGYQSARATLYQAGTERSDSLNYQLALGVFPSKLSRLKLNFDAVRSTVDHAFDSDVGVRRTGTSENTSYGGTVIADATPAPLVYFGAHRNETTNRGFDREPTTDKTDLISAGLHHGTTAYNLQGTYNGAWSEGSQPLSAFVTHQVGVLATATVGPHSEVFANDSYHQRLARNDDPLNPSTEYNVFSGGARYRRPTGELGATTTYTYARGLLEAPGTETIEQISHALRSEGQRIFSPTWSGSANVTLTLGQERLGEVQQSTAGQSVGVNAGWRRALDEASSLFVQGGPTVGLIEPEGGSAQVAYGADATVSWNKSAAFSRYNANYTVGFRHNLDAQRGWALNQSADASIDTTWRSGLSGRATLRAHGSRVHDELLGDSANRALDLLSSLSWRRYTFALNASLFEGPAPTAATQNASVGDGLFYPGKFTTTSTSVGVSATAALTPRLVASGTATYRVFGGGGVANQEELGFGAMLRYEVGLFYFSAEDRYVRGGATSFANRSNLFLFSAARRFGGGF